MILHWKTLKKAQKLIYLEKIPESTERYKMLEKNHKETPSSTGER